MGCAKGIVDEYVGEVGEEAANSGSLASSRESKRRFSRKRISPGWRASAWDDTSSPITASAIWDRSADEIGEASGHGGSLRLSSTFPLGRPMWEQRTRLAPRSRRSWRVGRDAPDAAIVEDGTGLGVKGDVEVHSDKDSLAVYVDLVDCFLVIVRGRFSGLREGRTPLRWRCGELRPL